MDKSLILEWIKNNNNAFLRENTVAHMTAICLGGKCGQK